MKIITFLRDRVHQTIYIHEYQELLKETLLCILDNDTKWNSTYLALKRFDQVIDPIKKALEKCENDKDIKRDVPETISETHIKELQELLKFLKPFYKFTKDLERNSTTYLFYIYAVLNLISRIMNLFTHDDFQGKQWFINFKGYLENEFSKMKKFLNTEFKVVVFLNPYLCHLLTPQELLDAVIRF